jgi:DNA (cytosine-5)-methyltransferase 1
MFSPVANLVRANGAEPRFGNLIPEFERCVAEAAPDWWLMENVVAAPEPAVTRYAAHHFLLCPTWLGDPQRRKRRFSFGVRDSQPVDLRKWIQQAPLERAESIGAVTSRTVTLDVEEMCELQGLPRDFFRYSPFTKRSQRAMIANGVPMVMGRAVAAAVRWATEWLEAQ